MYKPLNSDSIYSNQGNASVLKFLDESDRTILDIGCGAGDTGQLIREIYPQAHVTGITCSEFEFTKAIQKLDCCVCMDIERDTLPTLPYEQFDVLCFLHVLEHLVDPVSAIKKLLPYLKIGGKVIIALPNIANWRYRWQIALGKFEYTDGGVMDKTHLRFYTFDTAPRYLIQLIPQLKLEHHLVTGSIPLGFLRRQFLSNNIRRFIDNLGCRNIPNLFGYEILMVALRTD
ncbi:class I SAM-dependent methyltransferase [Aetokthonos hydrillicola Thurmond2011]|jgi:2-polyprenyl-3-methyl-5-hydroxy-6-metoxy-1,4-benzoquinol methylase|uniref:Class I SAM-dependent methyltransferase n=1 Tax=Aetokthonos hydrillicola Thurmond2011 TaxID=2712845 RepID=A0AAP5IAM3_9CYAN|nr:class I SAM-dependent methyltransferase [Aetokthonos hydrillicola]MBO3460284.1 class I SAM-dependent methyltransferase [Aetokthonos hydrillicola CCALA 1050]MBW4587618.1 class I SAM-dependent methyltransferase [Aetokthonos hydrillicola CCALA 1050]MDR9898000.1 class I SAM-dependent methyltransferase [Aetokthonos hydrillicola Thurmond2011]